MKASRTESLSANPRGSAPPADARWTAVEERDRAADGKFVYAVTTTGVFCRPSCPSRPARRENVRFFATTEEARTAGFRACRRCRPDGETLAERRAALVARACELLRDDGDGVPLLADLAARLGVSPWHLQRVFKEIAGVTPKQFQIAQRKARLSSALPRSTTVTDAIYEAGFGSSGRFYEAAPAALGMAPDTYRRGANGEEIRFRIARCSLGHVLVAATPKGVCAVEFADDDDTLRALLRERFPKAVLTAGDAEFERWVGAIVAHVERPRESLDLPLDVRGTVFQMRVWQALREIPPGRTASYSSIAERIGRPGAVRAVAQACACNRVAVAIPCHRVVRADGELSGYRWGKSRKRELLRRESDE